jgi:hypothetical protein
MSTVWIVSLVLAWVVIVLLTIALVSLLRQFGELRALVAPAEAPRVVGAELYDEVARVEVPTLAGGRLALAGPLLLVAHQPGCPTCGDVERALAALAAEANVVSVLALPRAAAAAHPTPPGLTAVAAEDLPAALQPAALPALVGISREGLVCALGQASDYAQLREAADATAGAMMAGAPGSRRLTSWGACAPYWEGAGAR